MLVNFRDIIIDYYTQAEAKREEELSQALQALETKTEELVGKNTFIDFVKSYKEGKTVLVEDWEIAYSAEKEKIYTEREAVYNTAKQRYKRKKGSKGILEEVRRIAEAYTKEDFLTYLENLKRATSLVSESVRKSILEILRENNLENFSSCVYLIYEHLAEAIELLDREEDKAEALEIIKARAALWYERPPEEGLSYKEPPKVAGFFPVLHGRATDAIAKMNFRYSLIQKDQIANTATLRTGEGEKEVKAVITEFDKLAGALGVGAHKLLMTMIGIFANNNHTGTRGRELRETEARIPLKEYAIMCGVDVADKDAFKNFRKKVNKDLKALYNYSLSWKEIIKGIDKDYRDYRIIDYKAIVAGNIETNFAKHFGEYLIQLPLNQYPVVLLSLDERNATSYNIGVQLSYHLNNDNNMTKGTAQLLKVKSLLTYTNLPSIDTVRQIGASWVNRIKEPLEKALDALVSCGYLSGWEYTHSKGAPLTDEEAHALINSYEVWTETLVFFTPKCAPDHKERLEAKAQRIAEAEAKKEKKPKKDKKTDKKNK